MTVTDPAELRDGARRGCGPSGYAVVDQELEVGLRSMAVPVHGRGGEVVAAMNISAPLERGTVEEITAELLPGAARGRRRARGGPARHA